METRFYRIYSSLDFSLDPSEDRDCARMPDPLKWAEIDLAALRANYRALRAHLLARAPAMRQIAVLKADAYGHGAVECARALLAEGCDFFAVACIEEALPLRRLCEKEGYCADILILGYTAPQLAEVLHAQNLTQVLLSEDYAIALSSAAENIGVTVRVHAAIDTGMNRIGFPAHSDEELDSSARALLRLSERRGLSIVGMYTHFAQADGVDEKCLAETQLQTARYLALKKRLEDGGLRIPFHHICNSAAAVLGSAPILDGVRMGILLYGARPSLHKSLSPAPVMRLCAKIVHTYSLLPGESVGYGGEFSADTERRIAVLPIGYADGFLRAYSGAEVAVHTATGIFRATVVGRICMDQCMIDVTDCDAAVGDTVTLFGADGITADALAQRARSIDYETMCLISARVIRVYR